MQSTSSSAEASPTRRSATEALAARYRHLFVLPGTPALVGLSLLSCLLLSIVTRRGSWPEAFLASSAVLLLSASAVSSALMIRDSGTIATFRRVAAVLFVSQLAWLLLSGVGAAYALAAGSAQPLANSVAFAALACVGLEFLVIKGAFTRSGPLSAALALVHPVGTYLVIGLPLAAPSPVSIASGVTTMAIIAAFPLVLARGKTSRGHDMIEFFQAFMKTWTSRRAGELEAIIQDHAETALVTTKVMRFRRQEGDLFIVMPGVHPGPFFPVGSYNLPGLVAGEFRGLGPVMTLHRPGGHERNLASNEEALAYARAIKDFAVGVEAATPATMRGPIGSRIGNAAVTSTAFGADALLTISFAPLGSDDLELRVEDELSAVSAEAGFDVSVIDAHNSISHGRERPDTSDPGWRRLFGELKAAEANPLRAAYAHSSETGFRAGGDVTENGVGLLMLEAGGVRSVLLLADANNAVPALHEEAARALEREGYRLLEFCTSDSHDMAAKGLTVARGYEALGEDTPVEAIRELAVELAKLAEPRLSACDYGSGRMSGEVRVFGSAALEEFASFAQASSSFAKRYSRLAAACSAVLFVLSLVA